MDPHTSDSEDEDDEDFVPVGEEADEDSEGEAEGKRKLDDDEFEDKPSKKKPKNSKHPQQATQQVKAIETEKIVADMWEEMKKNNESSIPVDSTTNSPILTPLKPQDTATGTTVTKSTQPTSTTNSTQQQQGPATPKLTAKTAATTKPKTFTFAGEKVDVPKPARGGSALDNLVSSMGKKNNKLSVLDKSKLDWDKFKTTTGSSEELAHQKKNGYLEKVAFLQRTDQRQFELEKQQRQSVRDSSFKQGLK